MAVDDLYRVSMVTRVHNQECVNVMYMKQRGAGMGDDAQAAANYLGPKLRDIVEPKTGQFNWNFVGVNTSLVSRINSDQGERAVTKLNTGPVVGVVTPTLALVISLRTGFAGRSRRGRIYFAGLRDDGEVGGLVVDNGIIAANTLLADLNAEFGVSGTGPFQLGVFSRLRYEIISNPFDDYWKPVTGMSYNPAFGNQRSRRPGVGT